MVCLRNTDISLYANVFLADYHIELYNLGVQYNFIYQQPHDYFVLTTLNLFESKLH